MRHGATPAITQLIRAGVPFIELEYEHDPAVTSYGQEAARRLDRDPGQVFKTLMVAGERDPKLLAIAVVPVSGRLNLKAMAKALGVKKVTLARAAVAERTSGYVVGGISPFGLRRALPTVVDSSARAWQTILVSGGRRGLDIEVAPEDLSRITGATYRAICEREISLNRFDRT